MQHGLGVGVRGLVVPSIGIEGSVRDYYHYGTHACKEQHRLITKDVQYLVSNAKCILVMRLKMHAIEYIHYILSMKSRPHHVHASAIPIYRLQYNAQI